MRPVISFTDDLQRTVYMTYTARLCQTHSLMAHCIIDHNRHNAVTQLAYSEGDKGVQTPYPH